MDKIKFEINSEDLIEELQEDCKELERELVKAKVKINSLGELIKNYSEQFENKYSHIDNVEEITELIESIGLMLQDNANTINGYLELRMNRE
jgi:translation initiation factor 2B subunit (eIF-2B alpha/beta/delta family)